MLGMAAAILRVPRVLEPGQRQERSAPHRAPGGGARRSLLHPPPMKPIKLVARGLVSGQVRLTPELLAALRQLGDPGDPGTAMFVTITEVAVSADAKPSASRRFGRLVSIRSLPPRRRCTTGQ